jgi:hypothetical protein
MNTADMREILKHLLDLHRNPDPSAYSHIPQYVQNMGAALERIERYESHIPEIQADIVAEEAKIKVLEGMYPFLLNRAPVFQEKVGTLKNGEPFFVTRRNYQIDMRPRPPTMSDEIFIELRTRYFGMMNTRQQAVNRLAQYQDWIAAARRQWDANISGKPVDLPDLLIQE